MSGAGAVRAPHAGAVRARARVALRALRLARLGEAICIGLAVALLALAAVVLSGGRTDRLGSAWVALLSGGLAAATWALEHRRDAGAVAARLDRAIEAHGAFLTAWEVDGERRGGPLAELLVERAARSVTGRVAARAALPNSGPILAAPIVAGALFAALAGGPDPDVDAARARTAEVAFALGDLAGEDRGGALSPEEERVLRELAREAAALGEVDAAAPEGRAALAEELERLGARLPAGTEAARRLDELAARLGLDADPHGPRGEGSALPAGDAPAAAPGAREGGSTLAPVGADGTMVGRPERPGPLPEVAPRPEAAWAPPGELPSDLRRILDDWDRTAGAGDPARAPAPR